MLDSLERMSGEMRSDVIFAAVQCFYMECKSHTYICY